MSQWYHFLMRRAGFVLAGGQSARMGRDKALLPFGAGTLVESMARKVAASAGSVTLIGDPARYGQLGFPVQPDRHPGCGPLGGLETALALGLAEWNLLLACDMPRVSVDLLQSLLDRTVGAGTERACIAPLTADGRAQPLCAIYHATCLPVVERAILDKRFRMMDLLRELNTLAVPEFHTAHFANANTPEDWAQLRVLSP